MSTGTRYSQVVARKPAETAPAAAVLVLLDTQTLLVESIEQLVRYESIEFDQVDGLLGDSMRKIATVRSAIQELKRQKLGHVTIASTG